MERTHRLKDKVAIVTGAASGIGRAVAARFAAEGATVVLTDKNTADGDEAAAALGKPHRFAALDVRSETEWDAVVADTVERFGRLDVLVNGAGVGIPKSIEDTTLEEWRFVHAVNSEGVFLGCRAAVRAMKEQKSGSIINVSSVAGLIGSPDLAAYCSSKGAVRLLTKSVALHCAKRGYGIRCNSVHPSFVDTPMVRALAGAARDPDKAFEQLAKSAPLGRLGTVEEVAYAILYLASDESTFTTGTEMVIDGGMTAT
ncbi:MAG: glucose 1-dehydrogenase [Polyangiaceae bacterium]|nr:glucose 1-dehydrogenase [Polyangiaceae bacterium]